MYNETIRDLLVPESEELDLREDPAKGVIVAGLTEINTVSADEVLAKLHEGSKRRSQEPTDANPVSSRSHAVLQVVVESEDKAGDRIARVCVGKLSMVDLAGSERASHTNVNLFLLLSFSLLRSTQTECLL